MSYDTISYYTISYHTIYHIILHHTMTPYHIYTTSFHTIISHTILYHHTFPNSLIIYDQETKQPRVESIISKSLPHSVYCLLTIYPASQPRIRNRIEERQDVWFPNTQPKLSRTEKVYKTNRNTQWL